MATEEWATMPLGEFVTLQRGHDLPGVRRRWGGVPVLGSFGITGWHDEARAPGPGVTLGRSGASFGVVSYSPVDYWPLNTALYVIDFHGNDPRFAYYFLKSFDFRNYNSGSAQPSLNRNFIHPVRVAIPPLPEQRAIAQILGGLDDKIDLNQRMNETLEAMAQALFKSWFVDFDPVRAKAEGCDPGLPEPLAALFPNSFEQVMGRQIPAGWSTTTLGEIAIKPEYGYTASASLEPVGPKFLRITDINKRPWIEWSLVPHCRIDPAGHQKFQVHRGDILIARMADPGHTAVIEEQVDAVFASYLIRFRPLDEVYARYLQYWTRSDEYWDLVRARGLGTTRTTLNAQVLRGFALVLPPRPIAVAFRRQVAVLRDRLVMSVREAENLAATRDTLLPKLISGDVRIPEAERMVEAT